MTSTPPARRVCAAGRITRGARMADATCRFCGLPRPPGGFFCGRCGGDLAEPSAAECFCARVRTAQTLIRNRVWAWAAGRVRGIGQALADDQSLAGPAERALIGLGRETERMLDAEFDLPRA